MHVFIAGIATETNTFAPFPTSLADFQVVRPAELAVDPTAIGRVLGGEVFFQLAAEKGWRVSSGLWAGAEPAGITVRAAYESLRDEMLDHLRAALPVDAVLLNLHGAMVAEGYDDCEEDMAQRVREIVGPDVVIGVELDLHCHLRQGLLDAADLIVIYKEYPHTDVVDRARELFDLVERMHKGEIRPTMALFDCKMIGTYRTTFEPMRSFVDAMSAAEGRDGVLSLSLGHGFAWGDVPHVGTRMLAITDGDAAQAQAVAADFGRRFLALRHEVDRRPRPYPEVIAEALAEPRRPVVIADVTDNPGGGAPSDSTFLLRELLARGVQDVALGMIWDPLVVQIAQGAGVGAVLQVRLGGKMGPMSGDPLDLRVRVIAIVDDLHDEFFQTGSEPLLNPVGDAVALRCDGVDIVVNKRRTQVLSPKIFSALGIDPLQKQILVVKSTQHFYAAFSGIASRILYADAPGALQMDYRRIAYSSDHSDKFPWVDLPNPAS